MSKYLDYEGLKQYNDKILEKIGETTVVVEPTNSKISLEDYAKIEKADNVLLKYNGLIYRKCARVNVEDAIQFECVYNDNNQEVAAFLAYTPKDEVASDGTVSVYVSDTSLLKVGMVVDFRSPLGGKLVVNKEIATIDETNKKITFVGNMLGDIAGSNVYITTYTSDKSFKLAGATMSVADEDAGLVTVDQWRSLVDYKPIGPLYLDLRSSDGSVSPWLRGCRIVNLTMPADNDLQNVAKLEMVLASGQPFKGNVDTDFFASNNYFTLSTQGFAGMTKSSIAKLVSSSGAYKLSITDRLIDGVKIIPLGDETTTSGTFKTEEVNVLKNNDSAYIFFNNEYYRLVKKTDTTLYYSCVSTDDSKSINKFFKISSSGEWTLLTLNVDLSNYYTKTESDGRYVKHTTGHNKVYATDSTGTDSELGYFQSPANSAIVQYTSSGTVRTNDPTYDLDAVNKQYGESHYYQLTEGKTVSSSDTIDLNTYKTAGTYNLPSSPKTNTPPDIGSATPGKLIVEYLYDNDHIIQSFYSLSNVGKQYRRTFDAIWSDWQEFATTSYVDNKTAVLIDNSLLGA